MMWSHSRTGNNIIYRKDKWNNIWIAIRMIPWQNMKRHMWSVFRQTGTCNRVQI